MSGIASGIGKVFTSVTSGIGSGIARLGSAVRGVGAAAFTGAAATGSSVSGLGSMFSGGGGILSNLFSGAARIMGMGPGGAVAGLAGAGPAGAATLFGSGGFGAAIDGGLTTASTATGMAAGGGAAAGGATAGATASGGLLSSLLDNQGLMGALSGAADSYNSYEDRKSNEFRDQAVLDQRQREIQERRDSYQGMPVEAPMMADNTARPTPAQAYAKNAVPANPNATWHYDKVSKGVVFS